MEETGVEPERPREESERRMGKEERRRGETDGVTIMLNVCYMLMIQNSYDDDVDETIQTDKQ